MSAAKLNLFVRLALHDLNQSRNYLRKRLHIVARLSPKIVKMSISRAFPFIRPTREHYNNIKEPLGYGDSFARLDLRQPFSVQTIAQPYRNFFTS